MLAWISSYFRQWTADSEPVKIGYVPIRKGLVAAVRIDGETDEGRDGVVNAYHATYKCTQGTVVAIVDWDGCRHHSYEDEYEDVCLGDVGTTHYIPDKRTAMHFFGVPNDFTGEDIDYDDDGRVISKSTYKNGVLYGIHQQYNEDGTVGECIMYDNGASQERSWHC